MMMLLHVIRRELAARWILLPAAIAVGALAMIAIHSIGHVRGDADGIMNGTWVGTLVVSTIVGMSLLGEELSNSRLSFYFARPFTSRTIFAGKLAAGVLLALFMQIAIMILVALALPELSWRDSALAQRDALSLGSERVLATVGCLLLGMAASIALGSKTRWFVVDALGLAIVGVVGTWFALRLEPDPSWLPADSIRSVGEKASFHAIAFAIGVIGLGAATARALVLGRTDRMRAHRTMSTTLWPIVVPTIVVLALIAERTMPSVPDPPVIANDALVAPVVDNPAVLARDDIPVPYLFVFDDTGAIRVGAAANWDKLDAKRVRLARPVSRSDLYELVRAFVGMRKAEGISGDLAVASISVLDAEIERESLRGESAISPERKRFAFGLSELGWHTQVVLAQVANSVGLSADRDGLGFPRRRGWVKGERVERKIPLRPLVLAASSAKAKSLIEGISNTGGTIAVSHGAKIRPLHLVFIPYSAGHGPWVEVRVTRTQLVVEAVPGTPVAVTGPADLATAIDRARKLHDVNLDEPVDILVDDDVDTQQLVDIVVALSVGGVRAIGLGLMPNPAELALRAHHIPSISIRDLCCTNNGRSLPLAPVRINRCYDEALVDHPDLAGIMTVTMVVGSDGKTATSTATGVEPDLANCVAGLFRTLERPVTPGPYGLEITFRP